MKNIFYHELAPYYDLISRDRDVDSQCLFLADQLNQRWEDLKVLELFAGPPHHASFFKKKTGSVICIDSSERMQQIAFEKYGIPKKEYWVGHLPQILQERPLPMHFNLVLALRYSLGLIPRGAMEKLLTLAREKMEVGGIFAIELHRIDLLMEHFSSLEIRERISFDSDGSKVLCKWPSGPMKWDCHRFQVEMPIHIEIFKGDQHEEYHLSSQETIYTLEDFERWISSNPCFEILPASYEQTTAFPQSKLALLRSI